MTPRDIEARRATRKRCHRHIALLLQTEKLQKLGAASVDLSPRQTVEPAGEAQILGSRQAPIERGILEHDADAARTARLCPLTV